jgi:hypothetical protein
MALRRSPRAWWSRLHPYFCGLPFTCPDAAAVVTHEAPCFGPGARLTGFVLPGAGHNMAPEPHSEQATEEMLDWTAAVLQPERYPPSCGSSEDCRTSAMW